MLRATRAAGLAALGGAFAPPAAARRVGDTAEGAADRPSVQGLLERFRALCQATARANVVDGRPIPSAAYPFATWVRDSYWTLAALGDLDLQRRTWGRFAEAQDAATGRVPTALLHSNEVHYARDDESTALFVLQALALKRAGLQVPRLPLTRAAAYLQSQTDRDTGRVRSGPGAATWWLDTFILEQPDTVAYTQGVAAVAFRALAELSVPFPLEYLFRAELAYAGLYRADLGAMTLSAKTSLLDVSCLVGEHLSMRLFQRPLLSDTAVANTLRAFRQVRFPDQAFLGFPVLSARDGSYLPESAFQAAADNWPGYYQNGGSWLLYDALALDAGRRHDVPWAEHRLVQRIQAELRQSETLHEYIATSPVAGQLGTVPFTWRTGYAWNSYVGTLI